MSIATRARILPPASSLLAASSILAAAALGAPALAQQDAPPRRTVTVMGHGEVKASPDLALIQLAVETTGENAARATAENARRTTAVIAAVKEKIGDQGRVTTTGYQVEPRYAIRRPGSEAPPEITGYIARNHVRVESRDLEVVGQLIDAAMEAGANRTNSLSFTLEHRTPHLRRALEKASAEARAQAESIASALGVRLVEVTSATTTGSPVPVPIYRERAMVAMAMDQVSTPVEPGEIDVAATLTVTYRIE
ncbi:MAG TPA: SIMPL domain-containing protein [Thermoanaerobaculia bacterium]|nr:SIMPL domain-containing protein [Thermoanaerobaculia bacterium]